MAEFNPSVPQQEAPNYTSFLWTGRQIPEPKPDESGKIIGKGIGDAIEGLTNVADTFVKGSIAHSIRDATDTAQDPFIKAAGYLTSGTQPPAEPNDGQPLNLLASNTDTKQSVPEALDSSLKDVGQIHQAFMQKGLPKTYYDMQLNNTASALRARYPGYREYIDNEFRKVTGEVPANAVMRDIFQQLSANTENKQHEYNLTMGNLHTLMTTDGFQGAAAQIEMLRKSGDIDAANAWIEKMQYNKSREIANRQNFQYVKDQSEANRLQIEPQINDVINTTVHDQIDTSLGMNSGQTPDGIRQLAQDNITKPTVGSDYWLKAGQQLDMHRSMIVNNIMQKVYAKNIPDKDPITGKPTGKMLSMADFLGGDQAKIKAMIDARLQAYDEFRKHIATGDLTSANYIREAVAAQKSDDIYHFNADGSPLSKTLRVLQVVHEAIPDSKAVQSIISGQLFNNESVAGNKGTLTQLQGTLATQPDFYQDKGPPKPATEALDEARKAGITSPHSWGQLLNTANMIVNPSVKDDKLKAGVAYGFFSNENRNMLDDSRFQQDYVDPETGRYVSQKGGVFAQMTSLRMSKEINRLGSQYTDLPQKQREWAEDTFKNHFLPQELARIREAISGDNKYLTLSWNKDHTGLTVNPKENTIFSEGGSPLVAGMTREQQIGETQLAVRKLNVGLHGLMNVAQANKTDPDKYALGVLASAGLNVHAIQGVNEILGEPKPVEPVTPEGNIKEPEKRSENVPMPPERPVMNAGLMQEVNPNQATMAFAQPEQQAHTLASFIKNPAAQAQAVEDILRQAADKGVTLPNAQAKLNPRFEKGLTQAIKDYKEETGRDVRISSLIRNRAQQARAYLNYLHGGGLAAPPGHSLHEVGEAADLNTDQHFRQWLARSEGGQERISKYGMEFLSGHARNMDPAHIQLARRIREAREER